MTTGGSRQAQGRTREGPAAWSWLPVSCDGDSGPGKAPHRRAVLRDLRAGWWRTGSFGRTQRSMIASSRP